MKSIKVFAGGKVNLSLNILGEQGGRHLLDSVMVSVSLGDSVKVTLRRDKKINIRFVRGDLLFRDADSPEITLDFGTDNTVAKAVRAYAAQLMPFGADIVVEKNLPVAGGLGGSSADIAGVLAALDLLFFGGSALAASRPRPDIARLGATIGSDVPFMLTGGSARVRGVGEILEKIDSRLPLDLVMAHAGKGVCAGDCYAEFDKQNPLKTAILTDNDDLAARLEAGDISALGLFGNALTSAAETLSGGINLLLEEFESLNAIGRVMTGSGCCVCGFFDSGVAASAAAEALRARGFWAQAATTTDSAIKILQIR